MKSVGDSTNWVSTVLGILAFILEASVFFLFLKGFIPLSVVIFTYLLVVFVILLFVLWSKQQGDDLRYPLLLLLSAFGSGPFGLGGFLLLNLLYPIISLYATPAAVWFEGLFPEQHLNQFSRIYQRVKFGWDDYNRLFEVSSFQDLFSFGSILQKQAVLDAITKDFNPSYSPILSNALKDPNNTVRIQAAAIVKKIDFDFEAELKSLENRYKSEDQQDKTKLLLAKHFDVYASLGILDKVRENEVTTQAIFYYREYLKEHPNDRNIWGDIGRLLFRRQDYKGYLAWCKEYQEHFNILSAIYQQWYLESLYRLGYYEELTKAKTLGI